MDNMRFDYEGSVQRFLEKAGICMSCNKREKSTVFETGLLNIEEFRSSFNICVNNNGVIIVYFPISGVIPKDCLMQIKEKLLSEMGKIHLVKLFIDGDDMIVVSYESQLPDNEELTGEEILNAFHLFKFAYITYLPKVMKLYWECKDNDI